MYESERSWEGTCGDEVTFHYTDDSGFYFTNVSTGPLRIQLNYKQPSTGTRYDKAQVQQLRSALSELHKLQPSGGCGIW